MSRILSVIALVLLIGVGITFTVLNPQQVTLNYLLGSLQLPLALLVVLVLALGAVLGLLVAGFMLLRLKRENRKLRRGTRLAEQEVANLRSLPVKDRP
ncbi:putative membrane protein [Thiohalobacter thiocyanaticus]|uniref:Probable lipopolysaccharide assembly protein A n=1 Tax=Thiohalobacter thiocyanaticus TaxID=585455 RepID=A0A1Z4VTP5_9GAMM|nr:lipopolysaccharide assembly protein LapA domain-containing protein [Thiohalobacter thiocyanaticus]BAZ94554.1 putative membrane protein [Thiohalobacter thiocyanaticus]